MRVLDESRGDLGRPLASWRQLDGLAEIIQ